MSDFEIPPDEELRIATLKSYEVLDTAPEVCFDDITELSCRDFRLPSLFY